MSNSWLESCEMEAWSACSINARKRRRNAHVCALSDHAVLPGQLARAGPALDAEVASDALDLAAPRTVVVRVARIARDVELWVNVGQHVVVGLREG